MNKRIISIFVSIIMLIGMIPLGAVTAFADDHVFDTAWTTDSTAHWHACTVEGCDIEDYATCGIEGAAYGEHTFENNVCTVCGCQKRVTSKYVDENGEVQTVENCIALGSSFAVDDLTLEAGEWYVTSGSFTVNNRIENNAPSDNPAHLILGRGAVLNANKGIHNPEGKGLVIYTYSKEAEGMLEATAADDDSYNAAIGGNQNESGGKITVIGGIVTAMSEEAAAIGPGYRGFSVGDIMFGDGVIILAGDEAPGTRIMAKDYTGHPYHYINLHVHNYENDFCTICGTEMRSITYVTRTWDKVRKEVVSTQTGPVNAEVITDDSTLLPGGFYVVADTADIKSIIAVKGTVDNPTNIVLLDGKRLNAFAGIEVAEKNVLNIYTSGDDSGEIYAKTGQYPAIGGNYIHDSGSITVYGGTVTAVTTHGAGIGGSSSCMGGNFTMYGGTVNAGSYKGAGIGGGDGGSGSFTIYGGTVNASSVDGAGIGGGEDGNGGSFIMYGGTVNASSVNGAGIGGGKDCEQHGDFTVADGLLINAGDTAADKEVKAADYKENRYRYVNIVPTTHFTVTFDLQLYDGLIDPIEPVYPEKGKTIAAPSAPQHSHYVFGGWYKEAECINPWDFDNDTVTEDITLYAKCIPGSCTVWMYLADEDDTRTRIKATYGQAMPKLTNVPSKDGMVFLGYYDIGEMGAPSVKYYNADGTSARNWDKETGIAYLVAHWAVAHEHTFSTEYSSNETVHWFAATCKHDVVSGMAAHTFGEGVADGNKTTYTCTVCGYKKVETEDETEKLLEEALAELDEVKGKLADTEEELAAMNKEKADLADKLQKKEAELAEANKTHSTEVESLKKEIAGLKDAINEKDKEINAKQATINSLNSQLDAAKKEIERLKEQGGGNTCPKCGETHANDFWGQIVCFFNRIGNFFRNLFK